MRLLQSISVAAALALAALPARANVVFDVSGVTTTGGALAGSFTTDDALATVVSFSITTPATSTFLAFTYDASTASVSASSLPSQFFRLDTPGSIDELQLYFDGGLTRAGGTLRTNNSDENQPSGGNRLLSGSVAAAATGPTAVPEPATFALLGTGMLGLAAITRRRT